MSGDLIKPIRVLHVVGGMNPGGVETWLMHVLRSIDRERFHFDFLVHTTMPCTYDNEIRELGSRIIPCLATSRPWRYAWKFNSILKVHGPYDIVHSHVHHYSGFVLLLARMAGVPMRFSHSHSDTSLAESKVRLSRKIYLRIMEQFIRQHATAGLAASGKAAKALYGDNWTDDPRWQVLFCGINLRPFEMSVDSFEVRDEFGIPQDAFVVGHVGRFFAQKNHEFLLDIAECLVKWEPNTRFLLVGDGPLRPIMESRVAKLGLRKHVIFTGLRSDVPRLMLGAMDAFLLPSLYEGLGLVLVEAQAAGLPCVFSDVIPKEADIVPPLIRRLSLERPAQDWADAIKSFKDTSVIKQDEALGIICRSPFNIAGGMQSLCDMYSLAVGR